MDSKSTPCLVWILLFFDVRTWFVWFLFGWEWAFALKIFFFLYWFLTGGDRFHWF